MYGRQRFVGCLRIEVCLTRHRELSTIACLPKTTTRPRLSRVRMPLHHRLHLSVRMGTEPAYWRGPVLMSMF
jgi:hypothetical protein